MFSFFVNEWVDNAHEPKPTDSVPSTFVYLLGDHEPSSQYKAVSAIASIFEITSSLKVSLPL